MLFRSPVMQRTTKRTQPVSSRAVQNSRMNRTPKIPKLIAAYPGQITKSFVLEGLPVLLTTTVTTGLIATSLSTAALSTVQNFGTRFGALFEEYRVVRVKFTVKTFSSTNPGLFVHWIDEKQGAAPTSAEALQKSSKSFSCASPSPHTLVWTANDPLDLQFVDIASGVNSAYYKVYTDNTNFGSSAAVTAYGQIFPVYHIQFRGYN